MVSLELLRTRHLSPACFPSCMVASSCNTHSMLVCHLLQAFAEFESSEEAVRAMSARNGDYIGDRYVKLLRVPPEEMEEQTGMSSGMLGGHVPGGMPGAGSGFGMQPGFAMQPQQPGQMMQHRPNAWGQVRRHRVRT